MNSNWMRLPPPYVLSQFPKILSQFPQALSQCHRSHGYKNWTQTISTICGSPRIVQQMNRIDLNSVREQLAWPPCLISPTSNPAERIISISTIDILIFDAPTFEVPTVDVPTPMLLISTLRRRAFIFKRRARKTRVKEEAKKEKYTYKIVDEGATRDKRRTTREIFKFQKRRNRLPGQSKYVYRKKTQR